MIPDNFSVNGLPKGLADIPFGKIFILTNPELGITSKNIFMMQFIFSIAKDFKREQTVNSISVDCKELWDCYICKVHTSQGFQILIADNNSIVEMLCIFWSLDYTEVCRTYVIKKRYSTAGISFGGHPVCVSPKTVDEKDYVEKGSGKIKMEMLQNRTRPEALADLRGIFQKNIIDKVNIPLADIIALYQEVEESMKKYRLDIKVNRNKSTKLIESCDLSLVDSKGNVYPLLKKPKKDNWDSHWDPQCLALYFTFILFKDGVLVQDVADSFFFDTFMKILLQLPKSYRAPSADNLRENVTSKMSVIRKSIVDATHDELAKEQFAIDGYEGKPYKVAGATEKNRALIRKEFGIV